MGRRRKQNDSGAEGILLVDKPAGPTSFDVVARMRRALGTRAIGHTGTLDPLAEGLMVVLVGKYTKLSNVLTADDKHYLARIDFGTSTTTDDAEGDVVASASPAGLDEAAVRQALATFVGEVEQTPPAFSAISVDGERLYEKARRGEEVDVPTRQVHIHKLELVSFVPGDDDNAAVAMVDCHVSKGTYIRAIARDVGAKLDVPAHLGGLRRTRAGEYDVAEALALDVLEEEGRAAAALQAGPSAVKGMALVDVDAREIAKLRQGQKLSQGHRKQKLDDNAVALAVSGDDIIALVEGHKGALKPKRVLPPRAQPTNEHPANEQPSPQPQPSPTSTTSHSEPAMSNADQDSLILVDEADHVVTVTINRPASRNALSRPTLDALCDAIDAIAPRRDVRAVIFTGAGDKAFSAGADLKERAGMSPEQTRAMVRRIRTTMDLVERLPMPTIAAVDGFAFGGGCELALACDMRVLGKSAIIGLTECALGIIPGAGGTQRLPRLVGVAKAKELIFTAKRMSADEALAIGLANRVVDAGTAVDAAKALAEEIKKCAPISVETAKAAIDGGLGMGIQEGLLLESRAYEVTLFTEDRIEALAAFKEKRPPVFQGK